MAQRTDLSAVPAFLRPLGLAPWLTWGYVSFYSPVLFPSAQAYATHSRVVWIASMAALSITLVVMLRLAHRLSPISARLRMTTASAGLTVIGTALIWAAYRQSVVSQDLLAIAGGALSGVGTAVLLTAWGEIYGTLGMRQVSRSVPTSWILIAALFFLISSLRPLPAALTTAALPIASVLMLLSARDSSVLTDSHARWTDRSWSFPRGLAVSIAAYSAAFAYLRGVGIPQMGVESGIGDYLFFAGIGLSALLLGVRAVLRNREVEPVREYRLALLLAVAGFLILPFLERHYVGIAATIISVAFSYFDMIVWIVLSDIVFRVRRPALEVVGLGRLWCYVGMLAGATLGTLVALIAPERSFIAVAVSLSLAYALVLVGGFSAGKINLQDTWGAASQLEVDARLASLDERCMQLAARHRLTDREQEILHLMARGRNVAHIADALHLSGGTVKTHVHHVYRKLDVHDRQALLDLVEQADPASCDQPR